VCRFAPPRSWLGRAELAGTILHDWGAHLIDQALNLGLGPCRRVSAWILPAPWPGVDSGGHGRLVLEFDNTLFHVETSRVSVLERPRWWILGTEGGFTKYGVDPQEEALRAGDIDAAAEKHPHQGTLTRIDANGSRHETPVETTRGHWDSYYANIADHLNNGVPLAVTAEQARDVVRILEAATTSSTQGCAIEGPWGTLC
ncbi:Gfo/Idh/MocA family protein, partial [Singulisphaera rosea]